MTTLHSVCAWTFPAADWLGACCGWLPAAARRPALLTGRAGSCALHARSVALEPAEPEVGDLDAPAVVQQDAAAREEGCIRCGGVRVCRGGVTCGRWGGGG